VILGLGGKTFEAVGLVGFCKHEICPYNHISDQSRSNVYKRALSIHGRGVSDRFDDEGFGTSLPNLVAFRMAYSRLSQPCLSAEYRGTGDELACLTTRFGL
jgi:hypothetical protein